MFKKGEICIVNEKGAEFFNKFSGMVGGGKVNSGDKVVCRETSPAPFCTPISRVSCYDFANCNNTWSLGIDKIKSTGEFMEFD